MVERPRAAQARRLRSVLRLSAGCAQLSEDASQVLAPDKCATALSRQQAGVLVDQEALRLCNQVHAVLAQSLGDGFRSLPCEHSTCVNPGVESGGETVDWAETLEPVTHSLARRIGFEIQLLVWLCSRVNRRLARSLPAHAV